jgi:hypothetical protein
VSRWRERVPRHRGRLRRCGRRVRPRAGWLRFRFRRRRLSPGPPFRSAHDRSCRASPPQWLEPGDTTRQGTMLVTRTTFRARTGEQLQCHAPLLPCASFALETERSSASVDFKAIRIAWIGGPVVSHAGIFADCEKEQVPRLMSFRGASSLGRRLSCHFVEGSSPHVRRRGAGVCKANGIAILRAERTGARELQMVWIRRTV